MIDYLKGRDNETTKLFDKVIELNLPFGISAFTYQELLQGARDDAEFLKLKSYLGTLKIYFLPNDVAYYEKAARMFFDLRRRGKTVRSTIDILIALAAIHYDLSLLHNDRDFDVLAEAADRLKILDSI